MSTPHTPAETRERWQREAAKVFVGRRIIAVRYMTPDEMEQHGWDRSPLVMQLDNGTFIYSSMDDEGNDAGALFTTDSALPTAPVLP